jgi:hypothetical protein
MNLKDIMAIGGYPGLFKFVSQAKNGIIVENLTDKKRMPAYASAKVSSLEDIAVFTDSAEIPLGEVFSKIFEKEAGGLAPDSKSTPEVLVKYFESILPDFDRKKVYISDIKKIISWYNILHQQNLLNLPDEAKEEQSDKAAGAPAKSEIQEKRIPKPAKKAAPKNKKAE